MDFLEFENLSGLSDLSVDSFDIIEIMTNQLSGDTADAEDESDAIEPFINIYLRHNLSLVCLEDVMKIYNINREVCDQMPTRKKQILKLFCENRDLIEVFYFINCEKCSKRVKCKSDEKIMCCGQTLKKNETNFFVFLPIGKQLEKSIKAYATNNQNTDMYSDAQDGEILKNILKTYEEDDLNILSLCLNVDGAKKFKSNLLSLWPIQFTQNFLPPEIRFLPHNIIIAGLFYTGSEEKLNFREFLLPLVMELNDYKKNPITVTIDEVDYEFKPVVTHCSVDLPAKGKIQETTQFGGYEACTYCDIVGELVSIKISARNKGKNEKKKKEQMFVRYLEGEDEPSLRSPSETLKKMLLASRSSSKSAIDGIKDISCLVALEHFNILLSIGVEYMRCILLGVTKRIMKFFVEPKNSQMKFYIAPKKRQLLNSRLLSIKPNAEVVRKPRSLNQMSNFKASEFRHMLLYYLPVCLEGCVPMVYVNHIRMLSDAVYILLKSNITSKEVDEAEVMLKTFVKDHQKLYGKENMVMNIHLLKHLAESVRQLGPLWCFSAFPFERYNGILLKMVNGTSDVLLQISSKYNFSKSSKKKGKKSSIAQNVLLGKSVVINENSLCVVNIETFDELDLSNQDLVVHKRIQKGGKIMTSRLYTRPKKSIDYFLALEGGMIGSAKFYIDFNDEVWVVCEEFEIIDVRKHISKVRTTNKNIVAPIDSIKFKYIYMKVGLNQYVTVPPNPYEKE